MCLLFLLTLLKYGPRDVETVLGKVMRYLCGEHESLSSIWKAVVDAAACPKQWDVKP
jgi:hypothetical protein